MPDERRLRAGRYGGWRSETDDELRARLKEKYAVPQTKIENLVAERMRFINENRERLVEAWIAETGRKPSECMLVQQEWADGTVTVRIELRDNIHPPSKARHAVSLIVDDLRDRNLLWESLDKAAQEEIIAAWEAYVIEALG